MVLAVSPRFTKTRCTGQLALLTELAFVGAGLPRHFRGGYTPPHGEVNSPLRFGGAVQMSTRRHGGKPSLQ